VVLDPPALEDEKVSGRDGIDHGTARQDIHKTAAGLNKEGHDLGKALRILAMSCPTVD
jgi:hypothetical protein